MRTLVVVAALAVAAPIARSQAQLPAPPDSELPTGTTVKFWSKTDGKWMDGRLLRFAAKPDQQPACIGAYSDELRGFVSLSEVDSLKIQKPGAKGSGPQWVSVSPGAIHARQKGCP